MSRIETWGAPTWPPNSSAKGATPPSHSPGPNARHAPAEPGRSSNYPNTLLAATTFVLALVLAPAAHAHSLLLASVPKADAVVSGAPAVTLRFNNRIEKKLSQIRLVPPRGEAQPLTVRTDGAVDALEAPLPGLAAGRYRVDWRVLSTDGHVVSGTFAFSVSP